MLVRDCPEGPTVLKGAGNVTPTVIALTKREA